MNLDLEARVYAWDDDLEAVLCYEVDCIFKERGIRCYEAFHQRPDESAPVIKLTFSDGAIGDRVFLTREEAEKKYTPVKLEENVPELLEALRKTGNDNHRCFGCGYEHSCEIHGCVINRAAAFVIKHQQEQLEAMKTLAPPKLASGIPAVSEQTKQSLPVKNRNKALPKRARFGGFLVLKCPHCGEQRAFLSKHEMENYLCNFCHKTSPLTNGARVYVSCDCGRDASYTTNIEDPVFDVPCIACGCPNTVEWRKDKSCYVPIGQRKKGKK